MLFKYREIPEDTLNQYLSITMIVYRKQSGPVTVRGFGQLAPPDAIAIGLCTVYFDLPEDTESPDIKDAVNIKPIAVDFDYIEVGDRQAIRKKVRGWENIKVTDWELKKIADRMHGHLVLQEYADEIISANWLARPTRELAGLIDYEDNS